MNMSDQDYLDLLRQTQTHLPGATLDEVRTVIALRWARENREQIESLRDEIKQMKDEIGYQIADFIKSFFDLRQDLQKVVNEQYYLTREMNGLARMVRKQWARMWAFIKTYRAVWGGFPTQFDEEMKRIEEEEQRNNNTK